MRWLQILLLMAVCFGLVACTETVTNLILKAERWRSGLTEKELKLNEFQISYLEGGSGEPVLLLHGFGADKDHWTRFARYLVQDYHVIALDLPGFGQSSRIEGLSYNADHQAQRIEAFRTKLGLSHLHIVGNSMGGLIATAYASNFPEQVQSLSLFNTAGVKSPEPSQLAKMLANGTNPLLVSDAKDMKRLFQLSFVDPPYLPDTILEYYARQSAKHRAWNAKVFQDITADGPLVERRIASLKQPLLVLWGAQDHLIDSSAARVLAEKRPDAEVEIIDGCGHVPMIEKPEQTARLFISFLDQQAVAARQSPSSRTL